MSSNSTTPVKERRLHRRMSRHNEVAVFQCEINDHPVTIRGDVMNIAADSVAVACRQRIFDGISGTVTIQCEGFQLVSEATVVRCWDEGFALKFDDPQDELGAFLDS